MKEEKMGACDCNCCDHGTHQGMMGGKHLYMLIGTLALVYGLVTWAQVTYMWAPYMAWVVGGAALIIIGWLKKWFYMHKAM